MSVRPSESNNICEIIQNGGFYSSQLSLLSFIFLRVFEWSIAVKGMTREFWMEQT